MTAASPIAAQSYIASQSRYLSINQQKINQGIMKYFAVFVMVFCFLGATLAQRKNPICAEEFAVKGPCRGIIPSWSYNQASGECKQFYYTGCQGSNNRFDNQEDCEKNCKPQIL